MRGFRQVNCDAVRINNCNFVGGGKLPGGPTLLVQDGVKDIDFDVHVCSTLG